MIIPIVEHEDILINDYAGEQSVPLHSHTFIELVFILEGTCEHYYLDSKTTLVAGDVFIIVPGEKHSYNINSKTIIINCIFHPELLKNEWNELKEISGIYNFIVQDPFFSFASNNKQTLRINSSELSHLRYLHTLIKTEYEVSSKGYKAVAKSYLMTILMLLGRQYENTFKQQNNLYINKKEIIDNVILYIHNNISNHFLIDNIGSKIFLNPDYFRRIFREVTGMSPIKYINSFRVEQAKWLLSNTNLCIGEVCEAVGINDHNYFSRMFREIEGISPLKYRKLNRAI